MLNNELLNNELRKNPFAVPDKYFDNLPSRVQDKCIMSKKSPVFAFGLLPKLAWSGGIIVLALALFLSYFNFNNTSIGKQNPETLMVDADSGEISPKNVDVRKSSLKSYRNDVKVEYLAVRNVNLNDYLASRY
ncbi:MAG: hypothetical protein LBS43_08295 [Prevotellaceae bacterium]|jgi:hypothetical protein|nr:hypothetical protein [Prevotellaceae bacterium]